MEITKREIIISISISAVMLIIGLFISGKITDMQNDRNAEYQKAVHIEDSELFQHGMDTNIGNAFVYGDLQAVDAVTFDEIGGEYLYAEKVKEKHTMHTRVVTYTTGSGKTMQTHTRTETYWTWDVIGREEKKCNPKFVKMINESNHIRYKYYGTPIKHTGTIYTVLSDGTISDRSKFFKDYTINQALESCITEMWNVVFWCVWVIMICGCVYGFCYLDNRWLED